MLKCITSAPCLFWPVSTDILISDFSPIYSVALVVQIPNTNIKHKNNFDLLFIPNDINIESMLTILLDSTNMYFQFESLNVINLSSNSNMKI